MLEQQLLVFESVWCIEEMRENDRRLFEGCLETTECVCDARVCT